MHSKKSRKRPVCGISVYAEDCERSGVSNREAAFSLQGVGVIAESHWQVQDSKSKKTK